MKVLQWLTSHKIQFHFNKFFFHIFTTQTNTQMHSHWNAQNTRISIHWNYNAVFVFMCVFVVFVIFIGNWKSSAVKFNLNFSYKSTLTATITTANASE